MAFCKIKKISALVLVLWMVSLPFYAAGEDNVIIYTTEDRQPIVFNQSPVVGDKIVSNKADSTGRIRLVFSNAITALSANAFAGQKGLLSVALPSSVTAVGQGAFRGCSSLQIVSWGEKITNLGEETFAGCSNLTSLVIPNSLKKLPAKMCYRCSRLSSVTLPTAVEEIGACAFAGDSSLTHILWPQTLKYVGDSCFTGCPNLHTIVCLAPTPPQGMNALTTIYSQFKIIFYYLNAYADRYENNMNVKQYTSRRVALTDRHKLTYTLVPNTDPRSFRIGNSFDAPVVTQLMEQDGRTGSVYFGDAVTVIGIEAFKNSYQLQSIVLPDRITRIEEGAFENCTALSAVTFGQGLRSVDKKAFAGCTALTEMVLPHATERIGDRAFMNCSALKKIVLGFGMTDIGYNAFQNCTAIDTIISYSYLPPRLASAGVFLWMKPNAVLFVPEESVPDYTGGTWGRDYVWKSVMPLVHFTLCRTLAKGESLRLTSHVQDPSVQGKKVVWTSSAPEYVSVNDGLVTAVKVSDGNVVTVTATVQGTDVAEQVQFIVVNKVAKEPAVHTVSLSDCKHGNVQLSCTQGTVHTPVMLTVRPDNGYRLENLTVIDANGRSVPLYHSLDNEEHYQFALPAASVTVTPVFVAL